MTIRPVPVELTRAAIDAAPALRPEPVPVVADEDSAPKPFEIAPVSTWAKRTPPPRSWAWDGWIPAGRVTSLMADGGIGKSLLAQTIATAFSSTRDTLYGSAIGTGAVLGVFSEEEQDELERRQRPIMESLGVDFGDLDGLRLFSRFGENNILATFRGGVLEPTAFYWRLDATCAALRPKLLVLDPAADFFGGNPIVQGEVRQFVQVALGALCVRYGLAILLPMHPSAAGLASGDGAGFSVAWNNSVRSRLYLEREKPEDGEASDRLMLTRKKANYAAVGDRLDLRYESGALVPEAVGGVVDTIREANHRKAVLRLLAACEAIGRQVMASPNSPESAAVILGEREGYPAAFRSQRGRKGLYTLLRRLEEDGAIRQAEERNASRHTVKVWRLTETGAAEAAEA